MGEVAGEGRAVVEQERNAVVGVPRRVHDLARDTDRLEHRPALRKCDDDVVVRGDLHIVVVRLGPPSHDRDRAHLYVEHQQRDPRLL